MDGREKIRNNLDQATLDELKAMIIPEKLPKHVAIIMDGNGRWAKQRTYRRIMGHRKGMDTVRNIVTASALLKLGYLTLYAFSVENWGRPKKEIDMLMNLLVEFLKKEFPTMMKNNISLKSIGRIDELPYKVQDSLSETIEKTSANSGLVLNLALNYGGHSEICDATKKIAKEVVTGKIKIDQINEDFFSNYLYTAHMPDPDLLIRTSGEMRISNFLLWQLAYSEFWITSILWPDFRERDFYIALIEYQHRERRFGKIL